MPRLPKTSFNPNLPVNDVVLEGSGTLSVTGTNGSSVGVLGVYGTQAYNLSLVNVPPFTAGALGVNDGGRGVAGLSKTGQGVYGHSVNQAGVVGESDNWDGVFGISHSKDHPGVSGHNDKGGLAGLFQGNVLVQGDITATGDIFLAGADCAEHFDIAAAHEVAPGTVLIIGQDGALEESCLPYDRRVAGVVSGAGKFKPGIILDKQNTDSPRQPIALIGKAYCQVDAQYGEIQIGDLLSTSATRGHAMKASDQAKAFGATLGKALRPLSAGCGLIPILVALQ